MEDSQLLPPSTAGAGATASRGHHVRTHLRDPLYRTGYLLIVSAAAGSLLGLVFWVLAARSYSAAVIGLSSALISAMMLVSGICSLGLHAVLVRYLPSAGRSARALVLRTYGLTAALSIVLGAAAALSSPLWLPELGFLADDATWLVGFVAATALWTLFALQDSALVGLRAAHWVPIVNVVSSITKIVLLVALAAALPFAGPFVAWNALVVVPIAFVSVLIFRRLIPRHAARGSAGSLDRRKIARVAAGNYGGTLFSLAATLLLPIIVANATSASQTAYFYMPWMIAVGLQLVSLNMATSFTVEAAMNEAQLRRLCRRALAQTMRLLVPIALVLFLAAPYVLHVFGGSYGEEGTTVLRLLVAGAIPNVLVAIGLAVARIEHRGRSILLIQAAQCVVVLGLSIALLAPLGIEGVGVAWLVAQVAMATGLAFGILRPILLAPPGS